jgi:SAM-dependent methyltransferase
MRIYGVNGPRRLNFDASAQEPDKRRQSLAAALRQKAKIASATSIQFEPQAEMLKQAPDDELRCRACAAGLLKAPVNIPDFEYAIPGGANYGECERCGSFTQTPMPSDAQLSSFYPASYHSFLPASAISRYRQKMRVAQLRKSAGGEVFDKVILDFGCGQGMFLNALAEAFPEGRFLGYEIGAANSKETRYDGRVTIFRGDTSFFWAEVPKVDIVTMNHVIEHLPDPLETVRQIFSILAPGGRLEGQTPNTDCYERDLFGIRWSGFHSPRHTVVFSKQGLRKLLEDSGFVDAEVRSGFNPGGWAVSLGSLLENPAAPQGIPREGIKWLALVLTALPLALVESRSNRSGIIDFYGRKPS